MKRKLILSLCTLLTSASIFNNTYAGQKGKTTTVTTISPGFLSAGSFGCWFDDFCTKTETTTTTKSSTIIKGNGDGTLTMIFDYSTFNDKNKEYYNGKQDYKITRDINVKEIFTDEELAALGFDLNKCFVPKGMYPIAWNKNQMSVLFTIK